MDNIFSALRAMRAAGDLVHDGCFAYGKYAGEAVGDVVRSDVMFICWLLEERTTKMLALNEREVQVLRDALNETAPPLPPVPPPLPEVPPPLPDNSEEWLVAVDALVRVPPPPPWTSSGVEWTLEQRQALDQIMDWYMGDEPFFSLTGPAGTGKTTLLKEIINSMIPSAECAAMTGKAALRMTDCTGRAATTLHKILYYPPRGSGRFTTVREPDMGSGGIVIIDEASMMSPQVYNDLQHWVDRGIRFLLVGDSFQLPPVITDSAERDLYGDDWSVFAKVEGAELKTVMRNAGGVLRAATFTRETSKLLRKDDRDADGGYEYVQTDDPVARAIDEYCNDRDDHLLITWRNAVRMRANRAIRERLGHGGPLPDEGEPVLIRKNGQGFLNGEVVTCGGFDTGPEIAGEKTLIMTIAGTGLQVMVWVNGGNPEHGGEFFDGGFWIKDWDKYRRELDKRQMPEPVPISWGYVLTAHAAQGSEARRSTVFLASGDERSRHFKKRSVLPGGNDTTFAARWLYTSLTRGKKRSMMILGKR